MHLICKVLALVGILFAQEIRSESTAGDKTSAFLKKKFENYDKALRPNFGGKPLTVTVSGYVLDLSDIDETNQEFTINLYLRHEWKDPRLEFTETEAGADKIGLNEEYMKKIWKVDSFIINERESQGHNLITENQYVRLSSDGTVLISNRFNIKASCQLSLGWFPFDRHTCSLILESYGYNTNDLIYQWRTDDQGSFKTAVGVSKETTSIKYNVAAVNTRQEVMQAKTSNKGYSRLAVEFFFIRASNRFVHEIFFPAVLITLLAFITLFNGIGVPKTRLYLSIFVEGLMIILIALTGKSIPPVSYQTALDFYLVSCLVIITCVVLVNLTICLMLNNSTESNGVVRLRSSVNEDPTNMEDDGKEVLFSAGSRFASTNRFVTLFIKLRFVIPLFFVAFNLLYWMIVLIGSSSFPDDFLILENIGMD